MVKFSANATKLASKLNQVVVAEASQQRGCNLNDGSHKLVQAQFCLAGKRSTNEKLLVGNEMFIILNDLIYF